MSGTRTTRGRRPSASTRPAANGLLPVEPSENPNLIGALLECRTCQNRWRVVDPSRVVVTIDPRWVEARCPTCHKRTIQTIVQRSDP